MKSHPTGWLFIWHIKERLELIAVVNEAPVALQSRDLSEAAAEDSNLPVPAPYRNATSVPNDVIDHVCPAEKPMNNGPADGMPRGVTDHHGQGAPEGDAGFHGLLDDRCVLFSMKERPSLY